MLMAQLTVVFNIMISNPRKIDCITSSLFTRWKKVHYSAVLWDKHELKEHSSDVSRAGARCIKAAVYVSSKRGQKKKKTR